MSRVAPTAAINFVFLFILFVDTLFMTSMTRHLGLLSVMSWYEF